MRVPAGRAARPHGGSVSWFSVIPCDGGFRWVLYAGNNHPVMMSDRLYRRAHHARNAARRLHKIVRQASFTYGRGFKKRRGRTLRP